MKTFKQFVDTPPKKPSTPGPTKITGKPPVMIPKLKPEEPESKAEPEGDDWLGKMRIGWTAD